LTFLNTNDRIINLRNVSNINILKDKNRIIFNLNYSIKLAADKDRLISDYVYWDAINKEDMASNLAHLNESTYFCTNFLEQHTGRGFININEISSIKFSDKKLRIIFNLSHPISFTDHDKNRRITSEFVYVNCRTERQYSEYVSYTKEMLTSITTEGEE